MTELLKLILSDFKHFIGTIILMGCTGMVIVIIIGAITNMIREKKKIEK